MHDNKISNGFYIFKKFAKKILYAYNEAKSENLVVRIMRARPRHYADGVASVRHGQREGKAWLIE